MITSYISYTLLGLWQIGKKLLGNPCIFYYTDITIIHGPFIALSVSKVV